MKFFDDGKPRWYFILLMIILLFGVDQVSKHFASKILTQGISYKFGGFGVKYITHQKFYFFKLIVFDDPGKIISSIVVSVVLLCILLVYRFLMLHFPQRRMFTWAFIFCFGGLFSNLVDNIHLGYARDFIVFWKLGITNFADIFYWVGLALFLLCLMSNPQTRKKLNRLSGSDVKIFLKFSLDELKNLISFLKKLFAKITKRNSHFTKT
ncbi:MAG: hypothetical protein E3J87_08850 [Candidatus Cloacimonadota bacterium]|nr:MAG: hypothetical protein E3J87_08850 [Candidatus Cloacimonadota bacterium]